MSEDPREVRDLGRTLLVGYGKLARRLAPTITHEGAEVLALSRSARAVPPGVRHVSADVGRVLDTRLPAIDSLIITLPPGSEVDSYRVQLQNLAAALPEVPERTVFVSSTGVFEGTGPDGIITEATAPALVSPRSRALRDGEQAAVDLFGATVLRPAGIYGPGRESVLRRVRDQVPADHARWTNRIHESDLVATLEVLVRAADVPSVLHAVDREPVRLGDVLAYVADLLALPTPPDAGDGQPSGHVLDGARLRGLVGTLRYPSYQDGYGEIVRLQG